MAQRPINEQAPNDRDRQLCKIHDEVVVDKLAIQESTIWVQLELLCWDHCLFLPQSVIMKGLQNDFKVASETTLTFPRYMSIE